MNATVKEYPSIENHGCLIIEVDSKKPALKNNGYNQFIHPEIKIDINLDSISLQRTDGMYFTKYVHSQTNQVLNVHGEVLLIYSCGSTHYGNGPYENGVLKLY